MAKRRKKNIPKGNHSALGAFIGSSVLAAPGGFAMSYPFMLLGSIAGGAAGGAIGAKSDRRKRGAIGGAVGGIFGPIGAAIGGYVGGRKSEKKKKNPSASTIALAVGAGVVAVGTGYGLYRVTKGKKSLKAGGTPEQALQKVLGSGTLEESPFIIDDVQQPILLQTPSDPIGVDDEFDRVDKIRVKIVRAVGSTTINEPDGIAFGSMNDDGSIEDNEITLFEADGDLDRFVPPKKGIAYLITGLSPGSAQLAYDLAVTGFSEGVNWTNPVQRDATTQKILTSIAPAVDWSQGLKPYAYGSPAVNAWTAVQLIGTVAWQSEYNKKALQ